MGVTIRVRLPAPPTVTPATPAPSRPAVTAEARQDVTALMLDGAGLALSVGTRLLRTTPIATELTSLVTLVDTEPRVRGAAERLLGRSLTDYGLAAGGALLQGLAQGWLGLVVDAAVRISKISEVVARNSCWAQWEPELVGTPTAVAAEKVLVERPVPLPPGPVERYADQVALAGVGAVGVGRAGRRDTRLALNLGLALLPKAAKAGRDVFASQLGRTLARRGVLVTDPTVLWRLDRVDTVLLDTTALISDRLVPGEVVPLADVDVATLTRWFHRLFHPRAPEGTYGTQGWALGPSDGLQVPGRGTRQRRRLEAQGARVLGITRDRRLVGLVALVSEPADAAGALAAAARRAGQLLVVADSDDPATADVVRLADRTVPAGQNVVAAVRELQAQGRVVLLVSRQRTALAQADCGLGVPADGAAPPWGAHVLLGDLADAGLLIDAVGVAREVSRRSVLITQAGSALGVAAVTRLPAAVGGRRAQLALNGAALFAVASAAWSAVQLGRTPLIPPVSRDPWHAMPAEMVLDELRSGPEGLAEQAVRARQRGPRTTAEAPPLSLARTVIEELANPLTPVLAVGTALSALVGGVVDAGLIAAVALGSALLGGLQRRATDRAVADLLAQATVQVSVRRDGEERTIAATELVPGDVVVLTTGDVVPADCRIIAAEGLEADESSLTGEAFPVRKTAEPVVAAGVGDRRSMVYEGTTVVAGRGTAVVVATGAATEAGRSLAATRAAAPSTGVETRLGQLTATTVPLAIASAAAVLIAGLVRGRPLGDTFGASIGLTVAAVPEGLPFLVTAAQLAAARRLSARGTLVRNPRTIEALGRVDALCFDKTGTLTEGRIRLAAISDGFTERPIEELDAGRRDVLAAALRATPWAGRAALPHFTDRAVSGAAQELRVARTRGARGWRRLAALPFEPTRGYHAVLAAADGRAVLSVKGAPEVLLPRCVRYRIAAGDRPMSDAVARDLTTAVNRLARQGHRILAVAERAASPAASPAVSLADEDVTGLVFVGLLALADPIRPTAAAAVARLHAAGVRIFMATGDHPSTAKAIAAELGLLDSGRVVTGAELDAVDDAGLPGLLSQAAVFARVTPAHKVRIVQGLQRLDRVVAMTGDGTNDAPAIRLADAGIALGGRSTPAARAAADLVVTDDRLETIVAALVEGRAMWGAVREALGILVGGNLGEIAFTVLGTALTGRSPLSVRQLLLVNLLTDLAPALAIALKPPPEASVDALLGEGPETSLGAALTRDINTRAFATASGAVSAWLVARATAAPGRAGTVGLVALVGAQLGQTLTVSNRSAPALISAVASALALVAAVQSPGLSGFFGSVPLGPAGWLIATVTAAVVSLLAIPPARAARGAVDRRRPEPAPAEPTRALPPQYA